MLYTVLLFLFKLAELDKVENVNPLYIITSSIWLIGSM